MPPNYRSSGVPGCIAVCFIFLATSLPFVYQQFVFPTTSSPVIFVSKPDEPESPLGNHLGELTDELGGEHITVFASGGPKNYCYRTNVRGITLDCTARQKVNFEVIRGLVYLHAKCQVTGQVSVDIPLRITRNTRTKEIETKRMRKDYRIVYDKRVITDDYKALPYGY